MMTRAHRIRIAPSRRLGVLSCAIHSAAAAALWPVPMPGWLKAAIVLTIAGSLAFDLARNALLRAPGAIVALEVREDGAISFQNRRGDWLECGLLPSTFVSPQLTVVNLRPRGRRRARHVILVTDNVDAQAFRRLRAWLRWGAAPGLQPK